MCGICDIRGKAAVWSSFCSGASGSVSLLYMPIIRSKRGEVIEKALVAFSCIILGLDQVLDL